MSVNYLQVLDKLIPGIYDYAIDHTEYKWYISEYYINNVLLKDTFIKLTEKYRVEGLLVYGIFCEYGELHLHIDKHFDACKLREITRKLLGINLPTPILCGYVNGEIESINLDHHKKLEQLKDKVKEKLLIEIKPLINYMEYADRWYIMKKFKHEL